MCDVNIVDCTWLITKFTHPVICSITYWVHRLCFVVVMQRHYNYEDCNFVKIVIKSSLTGFVATMHSDKCEKCAQSLHLQPRGRGFLHALALM